MIKTEKKHRIQAQHELYTCTEPAGSRWRKMWLTEIVVHHQTPPTAAHSESPKYKTGKILTAPQDNATSPAGRQQQQ